MQSLSFYLFMIAVILADLMHKSKELEVFEGAILYKTGVNPQ